MGKKNYGKSVKTRLLNLMNETGYKYMYLLARYFNERLLYRVSVSQYKDNFLLKGGSLLYAMNGLEARPTVDVDFLADRISRDRDFLAHVFQEILCIVCDEDGVSFDIDSIKVEPITSTRNIPAPDSTLLPTWIPLLTICLLTLVLVMLLLHIPQPLISIAFVRHSICKHTGLFLGDCCRREIPYDDRP